MPEAIENTSSVLLRRVQVWRAHERYPELSSNELAERLCLPVKSVRSALRVFQVLPADLLRAYAHGAVRAWVKAIPAAAVKGDHKPARDLLLHTRLIDPVSADHSAGVQIIFNSIAVPGLHSLSVKDSPAQIANKSVVFDASVTETAENTDRGGQHSAGDPAAGPANGATIFSSNSNG